jgi:hypothetical protein
MIYNSSLNLNYRTLAKAVITETLRELFSKRNTDTIAAYLSAVDFITDDYICGLFCDVAEIDYETLRKEVMGRLAIDPKFDRQELTAAISQYKPEIRELRTA